ncbi:hypothetical protein KIW84_010667 [Lathyrus oleraceus]|uniref:Uncharacterized protein n=1 Tax=Pisum sativum TaxID=3888 RepID=A0A9D4YMR0_PEA|nr:hypothetical protein KIW84_010667 [Pisum sativum]
MRIEDRELKQLRGKEIALVKVAWGGPAEKRLKSGKWRKGKEEEQGQRLEKRKAWSLEIAGLTQAVIESVFGLVVNFRTYNFLRNWNRRSGSPPTTENAGNSAFCLVLAQEQLLSCVNRLTQGVNRLTLLCILNNCCFVCVNRLTQGVNRLTLL